MTPLVSFIMPARNGAAYIAGAVESLIGQEFRDWELVVVDDRSTDETPAIVSSLAASDPRIRLERSPGAGQVQALNHGFRSVSGRYLKTIDCDDLVHPSFSRHVDELTSAEATVHQAFLLDDGTGRMRRFVVPGVFVRMTLRQALGRVRISPPRWSWTVSMDLARKIFPLPPDLPPVHEDVFYGLRIKRHAASMAYVPEPLYVYRQHGGQVFSGQYDYSRDNVIRRARSMMAVMDHVERSEIGEGFADLPALLAPSRTYFDLMSRPRLSPWAVLGSRLAGGEKARIMIIRGMPRLSSLLSRRRSTRAVKGPK